MNTLIRRSILTLAYAFCVHGALSEDKQIWADSILGKNAPTLIVEEWLTPEPDTKGKFTLIDFWATWCGPCRKAIPELNYIQTKFKDTLVVIGISDEPKEKVSSFSEPKPTYSLAIDSKNQTARSIKVAGIPHILLIDPNGIVRWEGYPLLSGHELTTEIVGDIIDQFRSHHSTKSAEQGAAANP